MLMVLTNRSWFRQLFERRQSHEEEGARNLEVNFDPLVLDKGSIEEKKDQRRFAVKYGILLSLFFLCAIGGSLYAGSRPQQPSDMSRLELLSRKQVTVHNCDSAGEALAEAQSKNPGWTAYNARNVSGRTWVVSMKKN